MYPVLIELSKLTIVVVGGGKIATRKVRSLVEAGGTPLVISPTLSEELKQLSQQGVILVKKRTYQSGDIQQAHMVFICTAEHGVNQEILREASPQQLINDTTKQENSNFFSMAFFKEQDIGVGVTTFGKDPKKSKQLKQVLQQFIQENE